MKTSNSESTIHSSFQSSEVQKTESLLLIPKTKFSLSRKTRLIIFITFIILSIAVDIDNGVVSASSLLIKNELNLTDSHYGLFASIPFTGRIVGLLLFMSLISSNHRQFLLISTVLLQGGSFFIYFGTNNIYLLLINRTFTAIMKSYTSIYMPVWIDQFGLRQYKTILFTFVHMAGPYGQVIGFTIGTVVFPNNWRLALGCVGLSLIFFGIIFCLFPNKYFSSKYMFIGYRDKNEKDEKLVATKPLRDAASIFGNYEHHKSKVNGSKISASKRNEKENHNIFCLFKSGTFMLSSLTRANMFFIFQIVHLFIKDYAVNGLKIKNEKELLYYYSTISITSPAIGSFVGGILSNKVGGYESHKSVIICILFGILNLVTLIPFCFGNTLSIFSMGLFFFFFGTSAILPTIAGYTIQATPRDLKGAGTGLDLLITTFLGKLIGPIIYGILNDYKKEIDSKFAWRVCVLYYISGFVLMLILCWIIWKNKKEAQFPDSANRRARDIIAKTGKYLNEYGSGDKVELIKVYKPKPARKREYV